MHANKAGKVYIGQIKKDVNIVLHIFLLFYQEMDGIERF